MTLHPARQTAHPFTDPTDWRDELDDIRRMLADAGRTRPLRDEVAQLLVEAGRGDRIVLALRERRRWCSVQSHFLNDTSGLSTNVTKLAEARILIIGADIYERAAVLAEATQ